MQAGGELFTARGLNSNLALNEAENSYLGKLRHSLCPHASWQASPPNPCCKMAHFQGRTALHTSGITWSLALSVVVWGLLIGTSSIAARTVSYDHRALLIDGQRRFLISGSIHYPRSTPQMWPGLIDLAKEGGLDVIETYVFWDGHEQIQGKYSFEGRYDLVRFLKDVHKAGLYVNLRIGPYISAEWNFGGLPEWLREIPGIKLRTDNAPFKAEMQRFVTYIVKKMMKEKLFYKQGGPIILSQVENEYGMVQEAYGDAGARYMQWSAQMAVNLNSSVPWIMCKQPDAPNPVIDTCNGFYCDYYTPNSYDKPKMWTENWPGWFHSWGVSHPNRPVEDVAYATARFFQKGGSFVNYYMYHGGTNFGRTSAAGVTTSYDYDAPIDEYGQARQPKWGHLKDLHAAIKICEPALAVVDGEAINWSSVQGVEIYVYSNKNQSYIQETLDGQKESTILCAAFVANTGTTNATAEFLGQSYDLPAWSVSILPDCKNVVFNTAQVAAQTSIKHMVPMPMQELVSMTLFNSPSTDSRENPALPTSHKVHRAAPPTLTWQFVRDVVGIWGDGIVEQGLLEQINTTHDSTDYLWYTTTVEVPQAEWGLRDPHTAPATATSVTIETVRDLVHVFVNGKPAGGFPIWNGSGLTQPMNLQPGNNSLAFLSVTNGLWYAGPFFTEEEGGLSGSVILHGVPNVGDLNLTHAKWIHQVGLNGEWLHYESEAAGRNLNWSSSPLPVNEPLVWYKTLVDVPKGHNPVVLDMGSMRKGAMWINGHHLGRYWPDMYNPSKGCDAGCDYRGIYSEAGKCFSECGQQSQRWYHVPREWLKPKRNVLILFEEIGGNVTGVSISTQVVRTLCSHVTESQPPPIRNSTSEVAKLPELNIDCGPGNHIQAIEFASFGNPSGSCGKFIKGSCHAPRSAEVVQQACLGRQYCSLRVDKAMMGADPCRHEVKTLAVQVLCKPGLLSIEIES